MRASHGGGAEGEMPSAARSSALSCPGAGSPSAAGRDVSSPLSEVSPVPSIDVKYLCTALACVFSTQYQYHEV